MSQQTSKCVYRISDADGSLLYVGCSHSPLMRAQDHCKNKAWARDIASISVEWFDTPKEAQEAEKRAIKNESPLWNIHHKPNGRQRARGIYHHEYDASDRSTWVAS